jgi:type VI secretion system protein ImpE
LIPSRYPGSETAQDTALQLSRKTEWIELAQGVVQGSGQRMLATDQNEYPLLDIRNISIDNESSVE